MVVYAIAMQMWAYMDMHMDDFLVFYIWIHLQNFL